VRPPLHINDLFWTLQGEGRWTGRRALFVRLPHCNYDCPWCDTEYDTFEKWSEGDFLLFARREPSRFAVITGGEPLLNKDLPRILELLKAEGFYIACETNGSYPAPDNIDFVTVSPKAYTRNKFPEYHVDDQLKDRASEFKYVVDDKFDFALLDRHAPFKENVTYSLSPEFSNMKANVEKIIAYVKTHPQWRLSLQTHKWIDIP
jgi:organic radical activating enzyme